MPRVEYKYNTWLRHLDPWDRPEPRCKQYDRPSLKKETYNIIIDETVDDLIEYYCLWKFPDYVDNGWEYCE